MNFNGNVNTGFSAFRWNPTDGLTELNPLIADFAALGWSSLEHIYDINDAGQLVGYGSKLNGDEEGFILTPISNVPQPGTAWLLLVMAPMLFGRRCSGRKGPSKPSGIILK